MSQEIDPKNNPDIPEDTDPQESHGVSPVMVIFLLIPLLGVAIALGMLANENLNQSDGQSGTVVESVPSIINSRADDFEVSTLDGQTVRLSDYQGRVVFLNFWATWCIPCIRELPALQQFASEQGTDGAVVLAANSIESTEQIRVYLDENEIDLSNVPVLLDSDSRIYQRFGIYQLPTTYVIDEEGFVRAVKYGEFNLEELYAYVDAVSINTRESTDS